MISNLPGNVERFVHPGVTKLSVTWTPPTASDNSGQVTLTPTKNPGDDFDLGINTVTYTAEDPAGNSIMKVFTVTISSMYKRFRITVWIIFSLFKNTILTIKIKPGSCINIGWYHNKKPKPVIPIPSCNNVITQL